MRSVGADANMVYTPVLDSAARLWHTFSSVVCVGVSMPSVVELKPESGFQHLVQEAFGAVRLLAASSSGSWRSLMTISSQEFRAAATAADAVALLEREMARLSVSRLEEGDWLLSIPPVGRDGFAIDLSKSGGRLKCLFGDFEEDFESVSQAMIWISRALSEAYQLRTVYRGGKPREWYLEPVSCASSKAALAAGHPKLLSFWRPATKTIRRNTFSSESRATA